MCEGERIYRSAKHNIETELILCTLRPEFDLDLSPRRGWVQGHWSHLFRTQTENGDMWY